MTLQELRASLKAKHTALAPLKEKALGDKATADDLAAFDGAMKDVESVLSQIDMAEREEKAAAAASKIATAAIPADGADAIRLPAEVEQKLGAKEKVSVMVKAIAKSTLLAKSGIYRSPLDILDAHGFKAFAQEIDRFNKALTTGVNADGGFMVPTNLSRDFIPLLRAASVIMASQPRIIDMRGLGNLTISGEASAASASYVGEAQPIATSQPTYNTVTLHLKKLAGIVPVSNELLTDAVFDVETQISDDLIASINLTGDTQMLRGTGSSTAPTGILNATGVQKFTANATVNVANIISDVGKAKGLLFTSNVPKIRPTWIMHPTTLNYLSNLRDTAGWIFPETRLDNPTFMGYPVRTTTAIPVNLGAGTNQSEVYLIDFGHVLVGDGGQISLTTSSEATVVVSSTPVSAYQNDLTLVRGIVRHDIGMRYGAAAVVIQGTVWQ